MFGPPPLPRQPGRPASSTPLADHLAQGWPGVDSGYVVLPRRLAESMSLPWQQQLVNLLTQFHDAHGRLSWPVYRVVPSRYERLVDLDEEQLAEAGYLVEIDPGGEMIYRERSGRKVEDPPNTTVLVSALDPIVQQQAGQPADGTAQPGSAAETGEASAAAPEGQEGQAGDAPAQQPPPPAPMNIGPQPVWHPVTPQAGSSQAGSPPSGSPSQAQPQPPPAGTPPTDRSGHADPEPATPPRGTPLPDPGAASASGSNSDEMAEFGPTGDPIEISYRYWR